MKYLFDAHFPWILEICPHRRSILLSCVDSAGLSSRPDGHQGVTATAVRVNAVGMVKSRLRGRQWDNLSRRGRNKGNTLYVRYMNDMGRSRSAYGRTSEIISSCLQSTTRKNTPPLSSRGKPCWGHARKPYSAFFPCNWHPNHGQT